MVNEPSDLESITLACINRTLGSVLFITDLLGDLVIFLGDLTSFSVSTISVPTSVADSVIDSVLSTSSLSL